MKRVKYYERLIMIEDTKKIFAEELSKALDLMKVPSPLFVKTSSGLQDTLSGTEKSVSFTKSGEQFEVVHSLAKWKREALGKYGFPMHKGLLTDMKAIRKEEVVDAIHSMYVEQWDWEKVISKEDRTLEYLKETVRKIYGAIKKTSKKLSKKYPSLKVELADKITFITTQELEDMYPELTPVEREQVYAKEKGAIFIIGIGDKLKSGKPHDLRSPDYDDWKLDGDIIVYDKVMKEAIELSSMGIRVDKEALLDQLKKTHTEDRMKLPFHKGIMKGTTPLSIGGGIGISRILLLLLGKTHIAEVQASSWEEKTLKELKDVEIL